jgi:hypothetical protein
MTARRRVPPKKSGLRGRFFNAFAQVLERGFLMWDDVMIY